MSNTNSTNNLGLDEVRKEWINTTSDTRKSPR